MPTCASCHGARRLACAACSGRRYRSRIEGRGELALSACLVCGGTGRIACHPCRGSGSVDLRAGAPGVPRPRARIGTDDALAGRWVGEGGWYQFAKGPGGYLVTQQGDVGQAGTGTAVRHGRAVTLDVTNGQFGRHVVQLRVDGDQLEGTMVIRGVEVPIVLTRA
jgi:hypothetical protein